MIANMVCAAYRCRRSNSTGSMRTELLVGTVIADAMDRIAFAVSQRGPEQVQETYGSFQVAIVYTPTRRHDAPWTLSCAMVIASATDAPSALTTHAARFATDGDTW